MKHEELDDLSKDDHKQYLYCNPTTDTRNFILPSQATTIGLTIKGALGQKAPLIRFQSFKGEDLGCIKADGSIKTSIVEVDEAISRTLRTQTLSSSFISSDILEVDKLRISTVNGINIDNLQQDTTKHSQSRDIHLTPEEIEHDKLKDSGGYTHRKIDQHIDDKTIHLTPEQIDHDKLIHSGQNTHAQLDAHLADKSIHYTQNQIKHGALQDRGEDHHPQYVLADGSRSVRTLTVDKGVEVKESLNAAQVNTEGLGANHISAPHAKLDSLDASSVKSDILNCNKSKVKNLTTKDLHTQNAQVRNDLLVDGRIYCEDISEIREEMEAHRKNLPLNKAHEPFTRFENGFVPAPFCDLPHDYMHLTGKGVWKSVGQFVELEYKGKKLSDCISDDSYDWQTQENLVTIPVRGVYEVTLSNIPHIKINQEIVRKSLNTMGNTFLLDLKGDGTTLELELSEDYSRIYIKKIDDYWSYY